MKTADELKARAIGLKDFVDYAAGSVVSKTLIDKKVGTLTLFTFEAGRRFSEHTAPYDTVVQILDGEADLVIAGKPVKARAGELVIMPSGVPHAVRAVQRVKMLLTMIREK
jgi:quercetin dioxygenase-like cupin family protein